MSTFDPINQVGIKEQKDRLASGAFACGKESAFLSELLLSERLDKKSRKIAADKISQNLSLSP